MNKIIKDIENINCENGLFIFSVGEKINNYQFKNSLTKDDFYNIVNKLKNDKYNEKNRVYKEYQIKNKYNNYVLDVDNDNIFYYKKDLLYSHIDNKYKISIGNYKPLEINYYSQSNKFYNEKKINKTVLDYGSFFIELKISVYKDNVTTYEIDFISRFTKSGIKSLLSKIKKMMLL
jgi:hypothetical protein